jgi:hypothetical protein
MTVGKLILSRWAMFEGEITPSRRMRSTTAERFNCLRNVVVDRRCIGSTG